MKDICIILAHCETERKVKILLQCIDLIKKHNRPILIMCNYPVSQEVQSLVDYVYYDKNNELLLREHYHLYSADYAFFNILSGVKLHFQTPFNHAYAVWNLIRNAINFCKFHDYEFLHFINYDCLIRDENVIDKHLSLLAESDHVFYNFETEKDLSAFLFSSRIESLDSVIKTIKSFKEYFLDNNGKPIEVMLFQVIEKLNHRPIYFPREELNKKTNGNPDLVHISDGGISYSYVDIKYFSFSIFKHKSEQNNYFWIQENEMNSSYEISIDNKIYKLSCARWERIAFCLDFYKKIYDVKISRNGSQVFLGGVVVYDTYFLTLEK